MKIRNVVSLLSLCFLLVSSVTMASTNYSKHRGNQTTYKRAVSYLDDAKITASVKSALFRDPMLSGFKIKVETKNGKLYLSGQTNTVLQFQRAILVSAKQKGVRLVIADNLNVRDSVTPHADTLISALANAEIEYYNYQYPDHALDMKNIQAEVHNKKIYIHGLAATKQQKDTILAILHSIDGNKGVYSALRVRT